MQGTSAVELGGLTNRIHSLVDQSLHTGSHDDHMDSGEPPSDIVPGGNSRASLLPQEGDSDVDVTCLSQDDNHLLTASSGDAASHTQSLPPDSLLPEHALPTMSAISFVGSDVTSAVSLFSLPLPPLPLKEDSSEGGVLSLSGIEGVTSIGALLEEMEQSELASCKAMSVSAASEGVEQLRAALVSEEGDGASMDSELAGETAPVVADLPTQLLAEGVVHCPIPLRSSPKTAVSPSIASVAAPPPQHSQPKASLACLGLSDHSPFKVVQQQKQQLVASPRPSGEGVCVCRLQYVHFQVFCSGGRLVMCLGRGWVGVLG